jgi:hypothetical protein
VILFDYRLRLLYADGYYAVATVLTGELSDDSAFKPPYRAVTFNADSVLNIHGFFLAAPDGFEPPILALTGRCDTASPQSIRAPH